MIPSPLSYLKTGFDLWQLTVNAQAVIAMRMLGGMGLWYASPDENWMMIAEKQRAAAKSLSKATNAALSGKAPSAIFNAALLPYSSRARANVRRLQSGKMR